MNALKTIDHIVEILMRFCMVASMFIMAVVLFAGVVLRVAVNGGLVYGTELCTLCIMMVTYGCTALAARTDTHIKISYLFDGASWPKKRIWGILINLISVILLAYLVYLAFQYANTALIQHKLTPVMKIPKAIGFYIVAVGLLLLTVEYVIQMVMTIVDKDKIYLSRIPITRDSAGAAEDLPSAAAAEQEVIK